MNTLWSQSMAAKIARWALIVPAFAAFAVVLLFGTRAGSVSVARAAAELTPPSVTGKVIVVAAPSKHGWFNKMFDLNARVEVCWVNTKQFNQIKKRWPTTQRKVNGHELVSVHGVDSGTLRRQVSGSVRCMLVNQRSFFFLPLDGNLS